jgi:hypothetical protein
MAKKPIKDMQERIRERLIQLIDESPARDLFEGRDSMANSYTIRDGDDYYILYNRTRWSFYKGKSLILDRKDEELVACKFTNKIFRFLEENDISTDSLLGI